MTPKIIYNRIIPLLLFGWLGFINISIAATQNPLDSMRQVFNFYKIPNDLQKEWIDELARYVKQPNSSQFRQTLKDIDEELREYNRERKEDENDIERPKKKKLGDRLKKVGQGISSKVDQSVRSAEIIGLLELAKVANNKGDYNKAIQQYEKAIELLEKQKKQSKVVEVKEDIADIYAGKLGQFDQALTLLEEIKVEMRTLGDGAGMRKMDVKIANLKKRLNIEAKSAESPATLSRPSTSNRPVASSKPTKPTQIEVPKLSQEAIKKREAQIVKDRETIIATVNKEMSNVNQELRAAEKSRDYRKIANLTQKIQDLQQKQKQDMEAINQAEKELMQQKSELDKQALQQRSLYGGLGALGIFALSMFFMYRSKQKDHKKLAVAYEELEVAQEELKSAEQKIKTLLDQQVSGAVAAELLATNGKQKKERRFVCVMFLDIRNFTPFVESKTPEQIIEYQNNVLGFMIEKVTEHGGIVNTILGDGFMATFGAPVSSGNDCLQAYKAAVEIMQMVKEKSRTGKIPPTKIGIGMHAGNVVAGNVGTKTRKQYLITGNTVIVAARLEQLNKQYGSTLIISREVVERLPSAMNLPKVFDKVMVKGRSKPVEIAKYG